MFPPSFLPLYEMCESYPTCLHVCQRCLWNSRSALSKWRLIVDTHILHFDTQKLAILDISRFTTGEMGPKSRLHQAFLYREGHTAGMHSLLGLHGANNKRGRDNRIRCRYWRKIHSKCTVVLHRWHTVLSFIIRLHDMWSATRWRIDKCCPLLSGYTTCDQPPVDPHTECRRLKPTPRLQRFTMHRSPPTHWIYFVASTCGNTFTARPSVHGELLSQSYPAGAEIKFNSTYPTCVRLPSIIKCYTNKTNVIKPKRPCQTVYKTQINDDKSTVLEMYDSKFHSALHTKIVCIKTYFVARFTLSYLNVRVCWLVCLMIINHNTS